MSLPESDLYYLRSILRHLQEVRTFMNTRRGEPTLGGEMLADNINWLDCFIYKHARKEKR